MTTWGFVIIGLVWLLSLVAVGFVCYGLAGRNEARRQLRFLLLLRRFTEGKRITALDHPGDDDEATVFMVIDEAAWATRDEADELLRSLGTENREVERRA